MISLLDQDNHTVKMSVEEIGRTLALYGNPTGTYRMVPVNTDVTDIPNAVLRIKPFTYPKYSWLQMLHKYLKGSILLDRKKRASFKGERGYIELKGDPVVLRLKYDEQHVIYVE